jgi:hypothetical protein
MRKFKMTSVPFDEEAIKAKEYLISKNYNVSGLLRDFIIQKADRVRKFEETQNKEGDLI